MAFAKGRAFVILNRMAESGNSEAKKILGNLNSMSQEDLDSKLSTLFGKGGTSKEGDTAPKDEKGGKAPEGKEEAPKGEKPTPKDTFMGNRDENVNKLKKDIDASKEKYKNDPEKLKKVNELEKEFNEGNEKENAQIKAEKGKVVANKDFDPNKEGVQSIFGTEEENAKSKDKQVFDTPEQVMGKDNKYKGLEGEAALKQANEDFAGYGKELDEKTWKEGSPGFEKASKGRNEALDFIESKKPKEMKSAKDGIKPIEQVKDNKNNKFFLDVLEKDTKGLIEAGGLKGEDATWLYNNFSEQMNDENKEANKDNLMYYLEAQIGALEDGGNDEKTLNGYKQLLSHLETTPAQKIRLSGPESNADDPNYKDKPMTSAKDGIKPIQYQKDFNPNDRYLEGIGQQVKDYLGKRKFMTEPNSEVQREIDNVMLSSENNEEKLSGIAFLKEKYEDNKVNLAALDKLEQEIEQEDTDEGLQQQLTTELEDEYTMFGNEPEEALEILKEKYANDDRKLAILDKIAATATKPADAKGSASNPMTSATQGIKPVENAEVVAEKYNNSLVRKGSAFDGLDEMGEKPMKKIPENEIAGIPEYTFEEAFGKTEATPLSYYSKDFKGKNEQYFVLKDSKGNKFFIDRQGYDYSRYYAPVDTTKKG
jgi:hypothetical protein